jgi:phosphoribosylamine--glycine ligase
MGAYAPYPGLADAALDDVVATCITPVVQHLAAAGVPFRGVLYAGLMLTPDGPRVLEYNVRFGDPETQVILPLLKSDALELFAATARGELARQPALMRRGGYALTVVAASAGYPESSDKSRVITGLAESDDRGNAIVFHGGTARNEAGDVITAGGRVLAVTGHGDTLEAAALEAYGTLGGISFKGMHRRTDIGQRGMRMLAATKGG